MKYLAIICLAILFTAGLTVDAFAEEKVVRMRMPDNTIPLLGRAPDNILIENSQNIQLDSREKAQFKLLPSVINKIDASTFVVYTKDELDSLRAADQKTVAELKGIVTVLSKNLADLADMNDKLRKRLDEVEKSTSTIK